MYIATVTVTTPLGGHIMIAHIATWRVIFDLLEPFMDASAYTWRVTPYDESGQACSHCGAVQDCTLDCGNTSRQ